MNWQRQSDLVRRALADTTPVSMDALLIPRNRDGQMARQMAPGPDVVPRQAAVLLLFYPTGQDLAFPLTVRSKRLTRHSGEVSLPGGAVDADDANTIATALRETHEELGIPPTSIAIWGRLTSIYVTASNYCLRPVVGFLPHKPTFFPNDGEIAHVFSVTLSQLLNPATVIVEEWVLHNTPVNVPFFALHGYKVWGATALVLSELVARIRQQPLPPQ